MWIVVKCTLVAGLILGPSACAGRTAAGTGASNATMPAPAYAALVGRVTDAETDAPLDRIQVFLGGTAIATRTDSLGRYTLYNIPPGKYTVVAAHATRFTQTLARTLRPGRVDTLDVRLRFNPGPVP
jgi:hypothetical protein